MEAELSDGTHAAYDLVVGCDGLVKARFVDPDFRHRMPTEDIVEAVREAAQD